MKYIQNQIEFNFKLVPKEREWLASINYYNGIEIEFIVNENMFEIEFFDKTKFDWEHVKVFTEHVIRNIDYLNTKSRMWVKNLYNGIGKNLQQKNTFDEEKGYFRDILAVELVEINRHDKSNFYYEVSPFHWSKIGSEMDCYHSYYARFSHISYDFACFEGVMRR